MREIKFRQPILVKGKFKYWHYWGFLSEGHFSSPETNSNTIQRAKETSQQYIGLKDKNGREIYEGDIVRYQDWDGCLKIENISYGDGGFYPFADNEDNAPYPHAYNCEVIGNIYEIGCMF